MTFVHLSWVKTSVHVDRVFSLILRLVRYPFTPVPRCGWKEIRKGNPTCRRLMKDSVSLQRFYFCVPGVVTRKVSPPYLSGRGPVTTKRSTDCCGTSPGTPFVPLQSRPEVLLFGHLRDIPETRLDPRHQNRLSFFPRTDPKS